MAILKSATYLTTEIFEENWQGEPIYPENSQFVNFRIPLEISEGPETIGFLVVCQVSKTLYSTREEGKNIAFSWLQNNFIKDFEKLKNWNFFHMQWYKCINLPEKIEEDSHFEHNLELTEEMKNCILKNAEYLKTIEVQFDETRNRLSELSNGSSSFGFKHSLAEARQLFNKMEQILNCSATMGAYGSSDVRSAKGDFEELARRSIENNNSYQAHLADLHKIVFSLTFPVHWSCKPNA